MTKINAPGFFAVWGAVVLIGLGVAGGYGPRWLQRWFWPGRPRPSGIVERRARILRSLAFLIVLGLVVAAISAALAVGLRHL